MALPRYVTLRGDTYYVRRPIPLDLQPVFGRKEITQTLAAKGLKAAVAASHGVLAEIEAEFEAARLTLRRADDEAAFMASNGVDGALEVVEGVLAGTMAPIQFSRRASTPDERMTIDLALSTTGAIKRPQSRAEALKAFDYARSEVDFEASQVGIKLPMDEDDSASLIGVPMRHREATKAFLQERLEADRLSLEAKAAMIAGAPVVDSGQENGSASSLTQLSSLWESQRKPAKSSKADMRTAIRRLEALVGPLPFAKVVDDHARRLKAGLIADASLKNATRNKLWGMIRALFNVAVDDGLLKDNPFTRVKLKLDDDSDAREPLSTDDLKTIFSALSGEEWWITRIGLYSGARLGEICQLTKRDIQPIDGVMCFNIRPDAETGKSVKTRSSIRKVPVHRQLLEDGLMKWIAERPGDRLFTSPSAATSKRLNRRMRDAGMGMGKVFHSFRHTFKGVARRHMGQEWHDRLTGHAATSVGQGYGDYDLQTLKEKIDLVEFDMAISVPAC